MTAESATRRQLYIHNVILSKLTTKSMLFYLIGGSTDYCSTKEAAAISVQHPNIVDLTRIRTENYYVSPVHSNESDVDDSDADPNFVESSYSETSSSSTAENQEEVQNEKANEIENLEEKKKGKKDGKTRKLRE